MPLEEGDKAPAFQADASDGKVARLKDLVGKWVVLYFYPKDGTPGCTKEACDFRDSFRKLSSLNAVVFGCSPDNLKAHDKFITKHELPFVLLSDQDHKIASAYGVWVEKNLYGKKVRGTERSTFLIDPKGKIRRIWRRAKVDGHAHEVLDELKAATA
jgi:peroxiredoxin Q/BCP